MTLSRDAGTNQADSGLYVERQEDPTPESSLSIQGDDRSTILIAGPPNQSEAIACWSERAGLRCMGRTSLSDAVERLARTVELDLLLVDLRGVDLSVGLRRAEARALSARYHLTGARLVVIVDLAGLDCAMALLDAPHTEFLCEPSDRDIVTLLVVAGLGGASRGSATLYDTSRDTETLRIEKLSEEVRRLAETIERLAIGGGAGWAEAGHVRDPRLAYRVDRGEALPDPARTFPPRVRHRSGEASDGEPSHAEIRARRLRDQYLPADLFADPAWDMILDLMAARLAGQSVSVSSLCIAASVPPTTALRWIRQLTDRAVFARIDDPADGRRVFIELTDAAAQAVLAWAQVIRRNGGILSGAR